MATNKQTVSEEEKKDSLWRTPITLDSFEDEDPLATLYQGREVEGQSENVEEKSQMPKNATAKSKAEKSKETGKSIAGIKTKKSAVKKTTEKPEVINENKRDSPSTRVTKEELKNLLKIKSDNFQFTDIREILRGNSFDIYAYLSFLSGDEGVCKITHQDLMQKIDISRPTLFKQSDWLVKLSLIEKHSVPGDHLGTSYTVHRLEDVLPISETLVEQIQTQIEKFNREID